MTSPGMASIASMDRPITLSARRGPLAASAPMANPSKLVPQHTTAAPNGDKRAPRTSRARMARAKLSVPNGCASDGSFSRTRGSCANGSIVQTYWPTIAARTSMTSSATATRPCSVIGWKYVDPGSHGHVDDQVHGHVNEAGGDGKADHHRRVAQHRRVDGHFADARPGEDELDHRG